MSRLSKFMKTVSAEVDRDKQYDCLEAFALVKKLSNRKFKETVEVALRLNMDAKKDTVRGATVLPHGTGKSVRIAVFTQGNNAELAKQAGADIVGFEDLAESIQAGKIDFDVLIATPDAMALVGKLGTILGPKGLMPNPKVGTVTMKVAEAVKNAKSGQVPFRNDKAGIIHFIVGKSDFTEQQLLENLKLVLEDIKKLKPASVKGTFVKKLSLSTTMGPGLTVDLNSLS